MKITEELYIKLSKMAHSQLNERGQEINNPIGSSKDPLGNRPLTLKEQIQRCIKTELSQEAEEQGEESFDEANDFDVEDEFEKEEQRSNYEHVEEEKLETIKKDEKVIEDLKAKIKNEESSDLTRNQETEFQLPETHSKTEAPKQQKLKLENKEQKNVKT